MADIQKVWDAAVTNHRGHSDMETKEQNIRFLSLALCGEAGELANYIKKRWRDGTINDLPIKLEIADVVAYAMMLAHEMGMSPQDLIDAIENKQQVFLQKMEMRNASRA